uniref:Putative argonaute n=1 Tax=Cupiennius salei TaxID=6928 RepID=A0A061QHS8_CUPSA
MPPRRGRGRGRGVPGREPPRDPFPPQQRQPERDQAPPQQRPPERDQAPPQQRPPQRDQAPPQQRPPPRDQAPSQQRAPPGFFATSQPTQEPVRPEPVLPTPVKEKKPRAVHPEELGIEFKQKLAITPALPRRPEVGNLGRRIRLISNCYPIKVPSGYVYHYDVEIISKRRNPDAEAKASAELPAGADKKDKKYRCMSTKRNREVIQLMLETNQNFTQLLAAYDGQKNLYTRKELKASHFPLKCEVIIPDENPGNPDDPRGPRQDVFEVQIKPVKKKETESCAINLDSLHALFENRSSFVPQETIMALETILRHGPCLRFTPIGRSFFYPPNPEDLHPLGGGREIWFGYHQSVRLGQWKPMVNLDITATTFYQKGPVLNYIAEFMNTTVDELRRRAHLNDADVKRISNELKSMRIEVNHLRNYRRKYRIVRLVRENANKLDFSLTVNGETVRKTVADYFKEQHNRELKYPNLPCLQVNPEKKRVYLPIEVCEMVEGQHCKKKLEDRQNADMIKFTARAPSARFSEIRQIVNRADFNRDRIVREFGIEVSREPLSLEGRVLDAPNVRYGDGAQIRPRDGSWNMQQTQFFKGAEIQSWVLLSFSMPRFCREDLLDRFAKLLVQIGNEVGMSVQRPRLIDTIDSRRCDVKRLLADMKNKYHADLAVIVVPSKNKTIYGDIKQAAETVIGLTTQCVKDDNVVKKCSPQLVSNLCQKINAKMGGVNNSLVPGETPSILRKPVIIIGADVTHPGPSHDIKPSLAACVGSLDGYPSRYAVTCRAQTNVDEKKQAIEIICDLKSMIIDLLQAFYRQTRGKKPEKIIFYRDGVSEGQFEKVRDHEVKCIREACRSLSENYQPGITFIVVQKRHHTRFMPQDPRDGSGKMKNIPPGTTVDTTVTHPLNFDFFLCSHFGLQGTSRPSHYTVIEDDNEFTANDLQKLTYYLCHTYVRCTKSISTPAPVAYAHLAAYRARQHLVAQIEESSGSSETSGSGSYHALPQAVIDAIKVVDGLKSTMYFV